MTQSPITAEEIWHKIERLQSHKILGEDKCLLDERFIPLSQHNEEIEGLRLQFGQLDNVTGQTVKGANHTSLNCPYKVHLLNLKEKYEKGCGETLHTKRLQFKDCELVSGMIMQCQPNHLCPSCKAKISAIQEAMDKK